MKICKKCQTEATPQMSKCFACGYTKFTEKERIDHLPFDGYNVPLHCDHQRQFPVLISAEEANKAFKKLGEALITIQKRKRNNEAFYKDSIGEIHDV